MSSQQPVGFASTRPFRLALGLLVVAWGVQAIVTQSLLLREALVLMFGSELAWGVVLFAWLLGVAIGAWMGGALAGRLRRPDFALAMVLLGLGAATCAELWIFRGARAWLGVGSGEMLPLLKTAVAALIFLPPTSALVGAAFPLACALTAQVPRNPTAGAGPLGGVYGLESLGSLIGGAAFSFWAVERLAPVETALLCAALTTAAAGLLIAARRRDSAIMYVSSASGGEQSRDRKGAVTPRGRRPTVWRGHRSLTVAALMGSRTLTTYAIIMALLSAALAITAVAAGDRLDRRLIDRRWQTIAPGYELRAEAESRYQNLAVGQRLDQYTLYCDGHVTADFPDPYTFAPLAHFWMCQHPAPRRVLVLGGGAEGLLLEILRHPVEVVDYVEPDSKQIELIEPYLTEADRQALRDPRVRVHHLDARYFLKTQRSLFDLVLARLPEPTSALRARFYTDEFYAELRQAMTADSVFCTTLAAAPGELSPPSAEYLASVRATVERHFAEVVVSWADPAHLLAATRPGLASIDSAELLRRYVSRGVQSGMFDPLWFEGASDYLDAEKIQQRAAELDAATGVSVSTDSRPLVYMQRLALWERMTSGQAGGFVERLRSVSIGALGAGLAGVMVLTLVACRIRGGRFAGAVRANAWAPGAITWSIATTGFTTMALSIVWLFAFQNLYGYVYQRIGWIIALFMGGLVVGCWLAARRSIAKRADAASFSVHWRRLIAVDVLLALLAAAIPLLLPALADLQRTRLAFSLVEWCISAMVLLTGVLGGAAFALAGGVQLALTGRSEAAAGSVVGADHAGACLGALLTGILLVPVFGIPVTAAILAITKSVSAALLILFGLPVSRPAALCRGNDGIANDPRL